MKLLFDKEHISLTFWQAEVVIGHLYPYLLKKGWTYILAAKDCVGLWLAFGVIPAIRPRKEGKRWKK